MCILLSDGIEAADVVILAHLEAIHEPRRNAEGSEHHHHRGCEILAVALTGIKKEFGQRISFSGPQVQGVCKAGLEISFYRARLVVRICESLGYFVSQMPYARVEGPLDRQLPAEMKDSLLFRRDRLQPQFMLIRFVNVGPGGVGHPAGWSIQEDGAGILHLEPTSWHAHFGQFAG